MIMTPKQIYKLRKKLKKQVIKANNNCTIGHKIREHASKEITLHYGQSMGTMRKTISNCPICKLDKWKTELLHILEIGSFDDLIELGIINHITNLIPNACIDCHRYFDYYGKYNDKKFGALPTPVKIDWLQHRIKVFQAGKRLSKKIQYNDLGHGRRVFESPVNFDSEINKLRYQIKKLQKFDFFDWTPNVLKNHMEDPNRWFPSYQPSGKSMLKQRMTTLFEFETKALKNGKLPNGVKRFDRVRPSTKMEYRFSRIPYKCMMCGCTHTLEIAHTEDLETYNPDDLGYQFNNTDVTAPLCKGCHGILDGNKHIKSSTYYTEWIKEFKVKHNKFRKKYRIKEIG